MSKPGACRLASRLRRWWIRTAIAPIIAYQRVISPLFPRRCKYEPTCSAYAAQAIGAFKQAGLDVRIRVPSDPSAPLKLVGAGQADLAISYEPELLLARDKGLRLASVGALVQKPLTSIISLDDKFKDVKDLKNAKVGTAGIPYQSAYLKTIATENAVDPASIHEINVGFNLIPSMLSKKVDATLGAFWNVEGVQLTRQHKKPTIIRMDQVGVPTYQELIFVAGPLLVAVAVAAGGPATAYELATAIWGDAAITARLLLSSVAILGGIALTIHRKK